MFKKKDKSEKKDDKKVDDKKVEEKKDDKKDKKEDKKKDDKKDDKKKDDKKVEEKKKDEKKVEEKKVEEKKDDKKKDEKKAEEKKKDEKKVEEKKEEKKPEEKKEEKKVEEKKVEEKKDQLKKDLPPPPPMTATPPTPREREVRSPSMNNNPNATLRDIKKVKSSDSVDQDADSTTPKKTPSLVDLSKAAALDMNEPFSFFRLINNPTHSDITFYVGQSQQKVYGHACVIEIRCPSLLKSGKKRKTLWDVDVDQSISYVTWLDVLSFLYTGGIDFTKMKIPHVLNILAAAAKFEGLGRLVYLAEQHLQKELNTRNMHQVLKIADELQLKFKEFVLRYAIDKYPEFVGNKEANVELGIHLFQEVVSAQLAHTGGKLAALVPSTEPKDTFIEDFKALYDSVKLSDISFKIAETNAMGISGSQLRGHKAIVVGRAPGLTPIVNQPVVEITKGLSATVVKNISPEAFESVMRWIYYNETNIPTNVATELVSFSQVHQLTPLQVACVQSMKKGIQVDTVLPILDVAYLKEMPPWYDEKMDEIRPECIRFAAEHIKEIDFSKIRSKKMSDNIAPDILLFLQQYATK